jgi:hypothetical protein
MDSLQAALLELDTLPVRRRIVFTGLLIFEGWNLAVIGVSLVAFNFVAVSKDTQVPVVGIWLAAAGTVMVTWMSVRAWAEN